MSTSRSPKTTLRPSKFIEGPPLTSTTPNLAQTDAHLSIILLEMDSYEFSRQSTRKSKSRTSSSSSANSNSSHQSHSSTSSFIPRHYKRMSRDYSSPSSTRMAPPTSASNKRFSGVRASLDMGNPFGGSESSWGRSRGGTIGSMNTTDEGSQLGLKIKGRLRAWSRGKADGVGPYAGT